MELSLNAEWDYVEKVHFRSQSVFPDAYQANVKNGIWKLTSHGIQMLDKLNVYHFCGVVPCIQVNPRLWRRRYEGYDPKAHMLG